MKIVINHDLTMRRVERVHADVGLIHVFREMGVDYHWSNDDDDTKRIVLHPQTISGNDAFMRILLDTIDAHTNVRLKYIYLGGYKFDVQYDK